MAWINGYWHDADTRSDELVQTLDFSKRPPPLERWLLCEDAVRDRLAFVYSDMLRNCRSDTDVTPAQDASLQRQAREAVVANIADQARALLQPKAEPLDAPKGPGMVDES